ncbi:MAG: ABC transporter substrate-binding protein [Treponema sp.]|nr:ABC transporter substrate-binding protein [Treponema sp.]
MKRLVCFSFFTALTVMLLLSGCLSLGGSGASGKIVIYTSMYEDGIEAVKKELKKRFPGCDIEFVQGGTGIIETRVAVEKTQGRLGCDILMVAEPAFSLELKGNGMLHPFKSKEASALIFDYDPEGYWYPVRVSNMVLAFNSARNTKSSVPNSFNDFASDSRVRGAVSMRNPLVSGTTLAAMSALIDKYGNGYMDALGRQNFLIDYGSDEAITRLENGSCRVVMVLEETILRKRQEGNTSLEVIYPTDGTIVIPSTIMIVNDKWNANKNIRAAEAIAEWFLSTEGQAAIVAGWMHSVRKDYPDSPFDSIPINQILENSMPVSWENVFRQKNDIRRRFEEIVAGRR